MPIRVFTDIPFGNACDVQVRSEGGAVTVSFAADPHGGPECLWFCFRLAREGNDPPEGGALRLVLKHSQNMLGCQNAGRLRPVIRLAGGDWERMDAPQVDAWPDGRPRVAWSITVPETFVDIALCYPYGRDELTELLRETEGCWRCDVIGVSQKGRPLVRLSNDHGQPEGVRPGIYLMCRQHSSETSGAWVLDGFLRHIATLRDKAPLVWAVPFSNIDGVEQGDYGKDNFPYDLNRAWGAPAMRHETLVIQNDVRLWKSRCRALAGMDFHSPGGCEDRGVYAYVPDPAIYEEAHSEVVRWGEPVAKSLGEYANEEFMRVARYRSRWETPSFACFMHETMGLAGFTFETPYAVIGERVLARDDYLDIGRRIAEGVLRRIAQL